MEIFASSCPSAVRPKQTRTRRDVGCNGAANRAVGLLDDVRKPRRVFYLFQLSPAIPWGTGPGVSRHRDRDRLVLATNLTARIGRLAADQDPSRGIRRQSDRLIGCSKSTMALFLELGLKQIAGTLIAMPRRAEDHPDRDRLALRFDHSRNPRDPCRRIVLQITGKMHGRAAGGQPVRSSRLL
jgi:hypothetical protein